MASYPELSADHLVAQLPYTEIDEWVVIEATLDCGASYTSAENIDRLRKFSIEYSCLTRAELTIIESFFDEMRGGVGEFDFTIRLDDRTPVTYPKCRFDQAELVVSYPEPGRFATTVKISVEP